MTVEDLKQYQHLQGEVRFWKMELAKELQRSYVRSPQLTGLPKANSMADTTAQRAIETEEIIRTIEMMQRRAEIKLREIAAFIKGVEDPLIRAVIYARYVKGQTWNQIADAVGESTTPDSLRKMHNRFFRRKE